MKDDSGSYAVFCEQGSSASQMTAAKIMDFISRLPGCSGQAADAVSAYTQVKMEDAPTFLKISKSECGICGYVYQNTNGLNHGPVWKIQSFLLSRIFSVILWQGYHGNSRKFHESTVGRKFQIVNAFFVNHEKKGLFLSVYVDDIKLAGEKQNISPTWKMLMKEVDLGEPTSYLDNVYLGCTQTECQIRKEIVDNYESMFESMISAGAVGKLSETRSPRKPDANTISSWSYAMEGRAKKCVERYCELANKTTEQ